jgi:hypothetical protein
MARILISGHPLGAPAEGHFFVRPRFTVGPHKKKAGPGEGKGPPVPRSVGWNRGAPPQPRARLWCGDRRRAATGREVERYRRGKQLLNRSDQTPPPREASRRRRRPAVVWPACGAALFAAPPGVRSNPRSKTSPFPVDNTGRGVVFQIVFPSPLLCLQARGFLRFFSPPGSPSWAAGASAFPSTPDFKTNRMASVYATYIDFVVIVA